MGYVLAAVLSAPRTRVELREFAEPDLVPGSLLLRTLYSEVCGTDVHLWHGRLSGVPYPIIPGHVSVGIVDKHAELRGCWGSEVADFVRALGLLDLHHATVPWSAIGGRTYVLAEVNEALAAAEAKSVPKALVKPN